MPKSMMAKEVVAYPDQAINQANENDWEQLVSVQSVVIGPLDDLWILDIGS